MTAMTLPWTFLCLVTAFHCLRSCQGDQRPQRCYSTSSFLDPTLGEYTSVDESTFQLELDEKSSVEITNCPQPDEYCFAFLDRTVTPDNITKVFLNRGGCWNVESDCSSSACNPDAHPSKAQSKVNKQFCCCSGDLCNGRISYLPVEPEKKVPSENDDKRNGNDSNSTRVSGRRNVILYGGLAGLIFTLLLVFAFFKWGLVGKEKYKNNGHHAKVQNFSQFNKPFSMASANLVRIIGQGRYGTVWLAKLRDQQFAVKMFPLHYSQYFYNEKDIYSLPFMEHSSLLTYFGHDEYVNEESNKSLVLVLSYCSRGNLQEYLKTETLEFPVFIKMTLSIAAALAHLHTEVHKNDKWKPCITHRDLNTRNILVKDDLSCALADLGLAVKITGSHYFTLDEEQHAETKSINDVGTLRYMAPEVLEGAVNLRDCESSLKQIDVYALGLVLWEMSMRVPDFFSKATDVPAYAMPFEKEVGFHPTLEEMQMLVCRNKARPLYPAEWKNYAVTRTIRETIDDCTDQDGEARLTALCVHERINQLAKGICLGGGVSPTFNQNNVPHLVMYTNNNNISAAELTSDKEVTDGGVSEGTVETILSPSESFQTQLTSVVKEPTVIQPYQARNPCLERNLYCYGSSEDVCVVETSSKHSKIHANSEESECLVRNPAVYHAQQTNIPYVQNKPFALPKQNNVSSNIKEQQSGNGPSGLVASLMKLMRKKEGGTSEESTSLTHVIVSPFEAAPPVSATPAASGSDEADETTQSPSPRRPSSLQLLQPFAQQSATLPSRLYSETTLVDSSVDEEKRLKELSGRIRTPGDLPASVRKKRGDRARLSLYDDRMMNNETAVDSTF